MTWKRLVVKLLDNCLGRRLLAGLASMQATKLLGADVVIYFDQVWHHQFGGYVVPDGRRFDYFAPTILSWTDEIPSCFRNADDFWFRTYSPKAGDIIIDVGAGRGEDVLPFAKAVGPSGQVYAMEANPESFGSLRRFCELNQLGNVVPIHAAVMDAPGMVHIENNASWQANTVHSSSDTGAVPVRAMTLDDLCRDHEIHRIDFLKMNIEGAETLALAGMKSSITMTKIICVCCHDFRAERGDGEAYRTRSFVTDFLLRSGFQVDARDTDSRDYVRDHIFGTNAKLHCRV